MAGKFTPKKSEETNNFEKKADKDLHGKCEVWGCNRWGHVHTGKWHCRYHWACHGKNIAEQLNHVTLILKNHGTEINWYENLLSSSEVDWVCDDLSRHAPHGMEPEPKEKFSVYRNRIELKINSLLAFKVIKADVIDRKSLASGDTSFRSFADISPEF